MEENPSLQVHPLHMKPNLNFNRHFKMMDDQSKQENMRISYHSDRSGSQPNDGFLNVPNPKSNRMSSQYTSGTRGDSIYLDAYTGFDEDEEQARITKNIT